MDLANESIEFTEDPLRIPKFALAGAVCVLLLLTIVVTAVGLPLDKAGKDPTGKFLLIMWCAFLPAFAIVFLIRSFTKKRVVTCHESGCDINVTNFWQSVHEADSFRWADVVDTNIVEEYVDKGARSLFLDVELTTGPKRVFAKYLSSPGHFVELLKFVDAATPHLPYVWETTRDFGDRQVIVDVGDFSKVARK